MQLEQTYNGNATLYATIRRKTDGKVWNGAAFETWSDSNIEAYSVPLIAQGGDYFVTDFPNAIENGRYRAIYYIQAGPTPDINDLRIDTKEIYWTGGVVELEPHDELTSYTTIVDADSYFLNKLYSEKWNLSNSTKKQQALNQASQIIDTFRYKGTKTLLTQTHEFPRTGLENVSPILVPKDIEYAQYEIAIALLKGYDPDRLTSNVTSRGFGAVRTTYDPRLTPEWLLNGIPSMTAWAYLSPYFNRDDSGSVKLHRAS